MGDAKISDSLSLLLTNIHLQISSNAQEGDGLRELWLLATEAQRRNYFWFKN